MDVLDEVHTWTSSQLPSGQCKKAWLFSPGWQSRQRCVRKKHNEAGLTVGRPTEGPDYALFAPLILSTLTARYRTGAK